MSDPIRLKPIIGRPVELGGHTYHTRILTDQLSEELAEKQRELAGLPNDAEPEQAYRVLAQQIDVLVEPVKPADNPRARVPKPSDVLVPLLLSKDDGERVYTGQVVALVKDILGAQVPD